MEIRWRKLIVSLLIWLAAELCLNVIGMDDLADCSEFVFEKHQMMLSGSPISGQVFVVAPTSPTIFG